MSTPPQKIPLIIPVNWIGTWTPEYPPFFPGSYIDVLSRCVQRNYNTNRAIAKSARGLVFLIFSFDVELAIYYRYVSVTSYMIVYTGDTE